MLELKEYISDDLSLFLKFYLTASDYKHSVKQCSNPPSEELVRAVVRQERRMSKKSIPCIENLIIIAAKKRVETNPIFTRVLREYSDIINRYKTK
tara:strand:+ start:1057 stop:1341 length:285 start_codon:yes stop_codon:yes gene_type:complete